MTTSPPPPVHQRPAGPPPRRSRARTVVPLAVAAWAVLEIWLLTVVASATSGLVVLLAILAGFVLGTVAVRAAGRSAWRSLAASVQSAAPAGREGQPGPEGQTDPPDRSAPSARSAGAPRSAKPTGTGTRPGAGRTGLRMLGGLLLIVPGFLSDAVGLLLLLPPTRKAIGALLDRSAARRLRRHPPPVEPGSLGDLFRQAREAQEQDRMRRPDGQVIQGEVVDRDEP